MRKTLFGLLAALMVLSVGAGTVTATGKSGTNLNACTNSAKDYFGGIKVYAKDKGKGANRVLCPVTSEFGDYREGYNLDNNLNRRNKRRPPLRDIWNRFDKTIESFKLRAAAGCFASVVLHGPKPNRQLFVRELDNRDGTGTRTRLYEIPRKKDNKATNLSVLVDCFPRP